MKINISNNNLKKSIKEDCKNRGNNKETSGTVFLKTDNRFICDHLTRTKLPMSHGDF